MKVHNIIGSQGEFYRDIGLSNWMEAKGVTAKPTCCAEDCSKKAKDGSHVTKVDSTDRHWYICPFCHEHNEATEDVPLKDGWNDMLVPLSSL